jgi:NAD+ synthase (glutamine-hydrolysing)
VAGSDVGTAGGGAPFGGAPDFAGGRRPMKVACAQVNPVVGDIEGNARKVLEMVQKAQELGATLVVFPEMCLTGYPPRDLLERPAFVKANQRALEELAPKVTGITAIVGFVDENPLPEGKPLYNAAAVIAEGRIESIHYKSLLPTYDVFDEARYFEPASGNVPVRIGETRTAVTICEDIWTDDVCGPRNLYGRDPLEELARRKFHLIVNISASPYSMGREKLRVLLCQNQAQKYKVPLVLCNQVGGNDELLFDGTSVVVDAQGNVIARAKSFEEDLIFADLEYGAGDRRGTDEDDIRMVYKALVMGVRDYAHKCGFDRAVVGLSGGIDSAVTAAIAAEALGAHQVLGVLMPSRFTSDRSIYDAQALAKNLGIRTTEIGIQPLQETYAAALRPAFGDRPPDVTEENLQARIRGNLLMAISNKLGYLVLSTGNKSELATGYCTLYGDMAGGLAVISDVPKTMVYRIAREVLNANAEVIPNTILEREPTAELRPDQKDTDTLPPYDVLDPILEHYVVEHRAPDEIVALGFDAAVVERVIAMVERAEYKRRQMPPGLRVTTKAFGIGRRYPIARKI